MDIIIVRELFTQHSFECQQQSGYYCGFNLVEVDVKSNPDEKADQEWMSERSEDTETNFEQCMRRLKRVIYRKIKK